MKKEYLIKKKIDQFRTDYRLVIGYIIAFLLLLVSFLITLYSNKQLIKQTQLVSHTHKVISDLETLLSAVKDGETGVRGFLNTKDSMFLAPFYISLLNTGTVYNSIMRETMDDPSQQEQLKRLKFYIDSKYDNIKFSIRRYLTNYTLSDELLQKNIYAGKFIMDSTRQVVSKMQLHENNLLEGRLKKVDKKYTALNTIVVTSLLLAFIFAAFGVVAFLKENAARQEANDKITAYQQELKQQIAELDVANKELIEMRRQEKFASTGRIARIIAHEVRNPLTNIDLAVSQIKDEVNGGEEINILFDMVIRNSNRINQLITELLNATRFTDLNYNKVSINTLLDQAYELAKDRITLNKIKLIRKYSTDICEVGVDVEKVKIAFLNLIVNAVEAMEGKEDATLTLITKGENNKCVVEIIDNGVGMDQKALIRLFEPYYTTKPKGNGLGLANTNNIILNHKGTIDVKSDPGFGTCFTITFDFA